MTGNKLNPIAENIGAGDALNMPPEAEFQLRPVEWRLFEFLFGFGERFDLEHHESVSGRVRGRDRANSRSIDSMLRNSNTRSSPMDRAIPA